MDFAPIDTVIPMFLSAGRAASDKLGDVSAGFFEFAAWVTVFWAALRVMAGAESVEGGALQSAAWFIRLFLIGTFGAFLLPTIIPALAEGALGIGASVGSGLTAADFMMPTKIAKVGWIEVEKLTKHMLNMLPSWYNFFTLSPTLVFYGLSCLVIMFSFLGMAIMMIYSYVMFIAEGMGTLVALGWMASRQTAWLAQGGPAVLASRFMQMVLMSATLSIGIVVFDAVKLEANPSMASAVLAGFVALIIAVLAWNSERIGAAIVGGGPGPASATLAAATGGAIASLFKIPDAVGMSRNSGGKAANLNPPSTNTPPGTPGSGGSNGSGHGKNPFGPNSSGPKPAATGGSSSTANWMGYGPGGLGNDVGAMPAAQATDTIRNRAMMLPRADGRDPTNQQHSDARLLGLNISGMSRSQAGAALDAQQAWFQNYSETGGKKGVPGPAAQANGYVGAAATVGTNQNTGSGPSAASSPRSAPVASSLPEWAGEGPGGLGRDILNMDSSRAETTAIQRAAMTPGNGTPPTPEQRQMASRYGVTTAPGTAGGNLDGQQLQRAIESRKAWLQNYNQRKSA